MSPGRGTEHEDPAQVFRDGSLIDDLKKAVAKRALDAEMDAHPEAEQTPDNRRNGHNRKRVLTDDGALDPEVPQDRAGPFEPRLVEKYARRLPGFDDKVISMCARGMTTRGQARCFSVAGGQRRYPGDKWLPNQSPSRRRRCPRGLGCPRAEYVAATSRICARPSALALRPKEDAPRHPRWAAGMTAD